MGKAREISGSGLFDELTAAFRAADVDLALAARDADDLTAAGAAEIAVLLIRQAAEKAQERRVFAPPRLDVARVHAEDRPDKRDIGQQAQHRHPLHAPAADGADENQHERSAEQALVQPVGAIAPGHKFPQSVPDFPKHVLSLHL